MKREFDKKPIPPGALFADSRFSLFYRKLAADADALGFDDFGVVPAGEAATFPLFDRAVKAGQTAGLDYLEADVETRRHPRSVLPSVAAMIIVVISQKRLRDVSTAKRAEILDAFGRPDAAAPRGAIVDYALGVDYHEVARAALKRVQAEHRKFFPDDVSRAAADTAPILEKDWATRADLGICGLNSLTIHPRFGSRFFLGELLVSTPFQTLTGFASPEELAAARAELAPRRKITADFCLTCRRCQTACATGAIRGDRTLDARRCLNYWTIEKAAEIPAEFGPRLGGRLFGCDACQSACPFNAPDEFPGAEVDLRAVGDWDDAQFRAIFRKTPIFRAKLAGLRRVAELLAATPRDAE